MSCEYINSPINMIIYINTHTHQSMTNNIYLMTLVNRIMDKSVVIARDTGRERERGDTETNP